MNINKIFSYISRNDISSISLVASNLVPLFGVLFWDWSIYNIMILFWAESAIIGFFNILKMQKIGGKESLPLVIFFLIHYGGFMFGHLIFMNLIFGRQVFSPSGISDESIISFEKDYSEEENTMLIGSAFAVFPAFLSLLISHGISYYENFIGKKEYLDPKSNITKQMMKPYVRIVTMHFTLIVGSFLIAFFKFKAMALILLIILKIIEDLKAHKKEHRWKPVMMDAQNINQ